MEKERKMELRKYKSFLIGLTMGMFIGCLTGIIIDRYQTKAERDFIYVDGIYRQEEKLVNAIIKVESNWNPKAVSKKGAIGLMQVRYSVWGDTLKKEGIIQSRKCLFDPQTNIKAGKYILGVYRGKHKDIVKALEGYSGGTNKYAEKVFKAYLEE
jgi:soluble lytic murein transglycosylase-like protein